jgi:hypothetical protein
MEDYSSFTSVMSFILSIQRDVFMKIEATQGMYSSKVSVKEELFPFDRIQWVYLWGLDFIGV